MNRPPETTACGESRHRHIVLWWRSLPLFTRVMGVATVISAVTHGLLYASRSFADFYNSTVSAFVRGILAAISGLIPFSLAETLLVLLIPLFILFAVYMFRNTNPTACRRAFWLTIAGILLLYTLFVSAFAAGYRGSSLAEKLGIDEPMADARNTDRDELYETARWLTEELQSLTPGITYDARGESVSPISFSETTTVLRAAFDTVRKTLGVGTFSPGIAKPIAFSRLMSYTHILGVYTFFTGEANVNTQFNDFSDVFTAAHEMAHQRGFAREDEANFMAFLVCTASDVSYIRYAGYWELLRYVLNDLYTADYDGYTDICDRIPDEVWGDQARYNALFKPFRESVAGKVSGTVNDTYLKIQGTGGSVSYSMVVRLAVGYHQLLSDKPGE